MTAARFGRFAALCSALGWATALGACGSEPIQVGRGVANRRPVAAAAAATAPTAAADAGTRVPSYRDEDFAEADTNRDPFRSYAASFRVTATATDRGGREVVMPETSLDEMRLTAIVSGMPNPYAMLVDREGIGHVVRRGNYVGRSEVVQAAGTEELPVTLNWRVDRIRIRPAEVVLIRQDPTAPNRNPLTRVIPLREAEE